MSYKELAIAAGVDKEKVKVLLEKLSQRYKDSESGLALIVSGDKVQLFTSPEQAEVVAAYLNKEKQSDLTRPSLETLSIIAYRGPVAKMEIERIRGVNCSLIIRNLLIRGLINEVEKSGEKFYEVSHDFLRFLELIKHRICQIMKNYQQMRLWRSYSQPWIKRKLVIRYCNFI